MHVRCQCISHVSINWCISMCISTCISHVGLVYMHVYTIHVSQCIHLHTHVQFFTSESKRRNPTYTERHQHHTTPGISLHQQQKPEAPHWRRYWRRYTCDQVLSIVFFEVTKKLYEFTTKGQVLYSQVFKIGHGLAVLTC